MTRKVWHDETVIQIADVFTHRNRKDFSSAVAAFRESGDRRLLVNLQEVTYRDSAALGLLALTSQQLAAQERTLSLVDPHGTVKQILGTVKQILQMANIDTMIAVFSEEEAAAARVV